MQVNARRLAELKPRQLRSATTEAYKWCSKASCESDQAQQNKTNRTEDKREEKSERRENNAAKTVKDSSLVAVQLTNESAHRLIRSAECDDKRHKARRAAYLHYDKAT